MIVYSHTVTPRVQYVVDFISQYYQTTIKLIPDEEKYKASTDPHKINYSYHRLLADEIWIHSHVLLFESTIRPVKITCFEQNKYKAFFKTEGDTGFDLLAATFYLLTRYEEYLPYQKDMYGRYAHQNSLAFKEGFLDVPLINIWLEDFRAVLQKKFSSLLLPKANFQLQATYDIDIAWSFKHKGIKRTTGAVVQLFFKGQWKSILRRLNVLRGRRPDPFDAYEWMDNLHQRYNLQPIYFFLVGAQAGKYDKNTSIKKPAFRALIKSIQPNYKIGLHPSWATGDQPDLLQKEKAWLEKVTEQTIILSRQHYIRFTLPYTYQKLLSVGILDDYSMGYGGINGFRASVANSFFWYDLKQEIKSPLRIHPFCFMDANAFYEEQKSTEEALQQMLSYYKTIKKINGTMSMIWHNSFLGTDPTFKGWKEVYEMFLRQVVDES